MGKRALDESTVSEGGELGAPTTEKEEYEALCQLVSIIFVLSRVLMRVFWYDGCTLQVNQIASPMANRKLAKKVYKLIKKASKDKVRSLPFLLVYLYPFISGTPVETSSLSL